MPRPVVLVTGAAQRIGRAIALELARGGHDLAIHTRRSVEAAEATAHDCRSLGAQAVVLTADLADETATRGLLPAAIAALGRVDGVVNNASTFDYDAPATFSYAAMEAHARANTAPAVVLAQVLHEHLRSTGPDAGEESHPRRGCVVNLLDQKLANPNPDYFSYTLSKAALQAATVMLAQALAPLVRVCAVGR
jgi:NAD(P)-dependent dehydrogenase (short-subunit alcohol dehydrogenase family)